MSTRPLMQVVVDCVLFFAMSDDEVIDPDEAVRQLESIAHELHKLQPGEQQAFLRFVEELADAEEARNPDSERIESMRQLGENLGLT